MRKITILLLLISFTFSLFACEKSKSVGLKISYDITAELQENYTLNASQTVTVENGENYALSSLYFTLYTKAFEEGATVKPYYKSSETALFPNGISYGKTEITKIKIDGKDAPYEIDGITLKVGLEKPLNTGETVSVYIEYSLILPNANHRYGYGNNTVNLSGFYPVLCVLENGKYYESEYYPAGDPFYTQASNFKVSFTVPSEYSVASSLSPTGVEWQGGVTTYNYERQNARDIALVLGKDFKILKDTVNGKAVSYYYFNDENPRKSLKTACDSLAYFENLFCPYPYSEYTVCQADFLYGGMEYSGLSLISASAGDYSSYVIAHETAHQWWHGIVGFNESEHGYLDEGLTELSASLYMDYAKEKPYESYLNEAKNEYAEIRRALILNGITTPPVMQRNLKYFSSELEYVMIAYNRSFIALNEVKNFTGNKRFFKLLSAFAKKYSFRNGK